MIDLMFISAVWFCLQAITVVFFILVVYLLINYFTTPDDMK